MDLTNKTEIKNLLKKYNARPEKYLGQHFILSKNALRKTIESAEINKNSIIFEIGPGLGTLTQELVKTGAKIVAIEKDPMMIEILKETLVNHKNAKVIQNDAKKIPLPLPGVGHRVKSGKDVYKYKIVANLPYNTATFLIRQWLESENPPELMVLMIQKEVAKRICAKPPKMNLLAVSTQFYAMARIVKYLPKESFWPKPKVDAAIIKIIPRKKSLIINHEAFFKALKAGFSQPRKQLIGNLSKKLKVIREEVLNIFKILGVKEKTRAENLSLEDWIRIAKKTDEMLSAFSGKHFGTGESDKLKLV